jgi:MoxR-like ATPase
MAEKQVTVDNVSYPLDSLFFVIATQNPLDLLGTYPLPLSQLDRFLFKIRMEPVDRESELEVVTTWGRPRAQCDLPRVQRGEVIEARNLLREHVHLAPAINECMVDIARAIRADKRTIQPVSTRSLVQAVPALQALAMLRGRDFVSTEDIEHLAVPLFQHRLSLVPGFNDAGAVIRDALPRPLEMLSRTTLSR